MPTLQELTEHVRPMAASLGRPVIIDLGETGLIHLANGGIDHDDGPADCRIKLSAESFESLIDGSLDPTMAYMTGQLAVDGDMGLALQLSSALRRT